MLQEVVNVKWAEQINDDFSEMKKKVDALANDFYKKRNEFYEQWLIIKKLLEPLVSLEILAWQKEHPHSTWNDLLMWVRSFATSDQELILYIRTWEVLVKKREIESEHHGRGHPITYSVKKVS